LLCMSSAYLALGVFASSFTNNQIVAFLLGLSMVALFHMAFSTMASNFTGITGETLHQLGTQAHFDSMSRGVIDSRDLLWFGSITVLGLALAELNLGKRLING